MVRQDDPNTLHPEVRSRKLRTYGGMLMMLGSGVLGWLFNADGGLTSIEGGFAFAFMAWGGVLVDPNTAKALLSQLMEVSPWGKK